MSIKTAPPALRRAHVCPPPPDSGSRDLEASVLSLYLGEIDEHLARHDVLASTTTISCSCPEHALRATMELRSRTAMGTTWLAGWDEELGWWTQPLRQPQRRYLTDQLVPPAPVAAAFVLAAATTHPTGSTRPRVHRYRLASDSGELMARLRAARPALH